MTKPRRWKYIATIWLSAAIFIGGTGYAVDHMMVEEERFHSVYRTGNWIAAQTQLEFQRFTGALDRYALGDPAVGRDELI